MKTALNTREPRIICPTLKVLQQIILLSPMAGQALVPYYRQVHNIDIFFQRFQEKTKWKRTGREGQGGTGGGA